MTAASNSPPPEVAIRARPPSPRRLNRKVLLAGACLVGGVIAIALVAGLSGRPDRVAESPNATAAAGPPTSILDASAQYRAEDLAPPQAGWAEVEHEDENPAQSDTAGPPPMQRATARIEAEDRAGSAADTDALARASHILFGDKSAPPGATERSAGDVGRHAAFLQAQRESGAQLGERLRPVSSPYTLLAGAIVPAALVTALNSDMPGRVIAQVTSPVFDSVSGKHLLVPQGARLIGGYDSGAAYGDSRLLVVWNRLVLPNGASINLRAMEATDAAGAAGVADRTDRHLDRLAGAIGLSAIFSVFANEAEGDAKTATFGQSVGDAAAQEAARTGARIVEREMAVKPTLHVRAGAAVRLLVTRDIVLRPYPPQATP